ncbi:MAG: hypothetical protein HRF43_03455 [Phycisphaerae bacterium]
MQPPRIEHLRRMTDSKGLIHAAMGDCPDRFSGYRALDNADALRLCAQVSDAVQGERVLPLARVYFDYLWRSRSGDGRVHHACDARGQWSSRQDDALVQSRLARALAAVIVSELPIGLRLKAADWWRELLVHAGRVHHAQSAANWLIAIGQLGAADPGRDLQRARRLADWLVEECYRRIRRDGWEWFEPAWTSGGACIPQGLWHASAMLDEPAYARIAEESTRFLVEHFFEGDLLVPPGVGGSWSRTSSKPLHDQLPSDAAAMTELLCAAERIGAWADAGRLAELAARWFAGNNEQGAVLIDTGTGACADRLGPAGAASDRGGSAAVAYLLAEAARAVRAAQAAEPPVYLVPING